MDEASIEALAVESGFSGVIAVDRGDERVFTGAWGMAYRSLGVANSIQTRFALASGGKTFTALAVMRLVEDGVLSLDGRARAWLGDDLSLIDDAVTVEQLLTHTSGIGDYIDEDSDWDPADYVLTVPVQELAETESMLRVLDGFPQVFAPGERYKYCNGGYVVLSLIAERASGVEYHELVRQQVLAPAGLERTAFLRTDELPGDAALGYLGNDSDRTNIFHLPVRGVGDGGIYSCVDDLHAFWGALLDGRIVTRDTAAAMLIPRNDDPEEGMRYGMGFYLHATGPAASLGGMDAGVSFKSTHDPVSGTTATVISNTSDGAWPMVAALGALFD